jgi:2-succinyl-6-hydroxy-2,4-cyclohexadiene-1-carboxylate synthase
MNKNDLAPTLYAIHGFLGLSTDWEVLNPLNLPIKDIIPIDIYNISPPSQGFNAWARNLNALVEKDKTPRILMGYSLGGRLAMHALLAQPSLWDAAIFISTHPGLDCPEQKKIRLHADLSWSQKFQTESWNTLISAWNSQPVFKNSTSLQREEIDYSRECLADTLKYWSLGHQENLRPFLQKQPLPILWLRGRDDASSAIAPELVHPDSKLALIPQAGHRVLWDQPQLVHQQLFDFIKHLTRRYNHAMPNHTME